MRLLYCVRELFCYPGRRPLCFSPSVPLFRVDFVHGLLRPCKGFDWERRPYPPRALWAFVLIQSPRFVSCVMDFDFIFGAHDCKVSMSSLL